MTVARVAYFNEIDQRWQSASDFLEGTVGADKNTFNNSKHASALATDLESRYGMAFRAEVQNPGKRNEWVPLVDDGAVKKAAVERARELVRS